LIVINYNFLTKTFEAKKIIQNLENSIIHLLFTNVKINLIIFINFASSFSIQIDKFFF